MCNRCQSNQMSKARDSKGNGCPCCASQYGMWSKMFENVHAKFWSLEDMEAGNIWILTRIQFLELIVFYRDRIQRHNLQKTRTKWTIKHFKALFLGKGSKRYLKQSKPVFISICLCLSLSLSIVSIIYIYIYIYIYISVIFSLSPRSGSPSARSLNNYHISQLLHWQLIRPIPLGPW